MDGKARTTHGDAPEAETPGRPGRLRSFFALVLWFGTFGSALLLSQFVYIHLGLGLGRFETLVGVWIEASLIVPGSLGLGVLGAAALVWHHRNSTQQLPPLKAWLLPPAVSGLLLWGALALGSGASPDRLPHPDVVVLMIDTLRRDFVDDERTPHLAALGRSSFIFDDAVSASPWTRPAVGSMMTGLHPEEHGANRDDPIRDDVPTLAARFRRAGYETTALVSNPQLSPKSGFPRGFDYHSHLLTWDFPFALSGHFRYPTDAAPALLQWRRASLYSRFVRDPARPWFLFLHFMDPHLPLRPNERWKAQERRAHPDQTDHRTRYGAVLRRMDAEIGKYLAELRSQGRLQHTIIAMLSDHGEELDGDGRTWPEEVRNHNGHGHSMLPEVIRVPLQIHVPGMSDGGTCSGTVSTRRLAATLLELAGVEHSGVFGVPLLDAQGTCTGHLPMTYQSGMLYGPPTTASRDADRTVIVIPERDAWQSFDRRRDPEHRKPEAAVPEERRADVVEHLSRFGITPGVPIRRAHKRKAMEIDPLLRKQLEAVGYVQ